jgi:hypothetical protein
MNSWEATLYIIVAKINFNLFVLTTHSSASSLGAPVLRRIINGQIYADYGPDDQVCDTETGHAFCTASELVADWSSEPDRTPKERSAAAWFCLRQAKAS